MLLGGLVSTHLEKICASLNWIVSPRIGVKVNILDNHPFLGAMLVSNREFESTTETVGFCPESFRSNVKFLTIDWLTLTSWVPSSPAICCTGGLLRKNSHQSFLKMPSFYRNNLLRWVRRKRQLENCRMHVFLLEDGSNRQTSLIWGGRGVKTMKPFETSKRWNRTST